MLMSIRPFKFLAIAAVLICSLPCSSSDAQEPKPATELPFRVRAIFAAKCSECHGRGLQRPKAALYLDDLGPLAARRDLVVPNDVEGSYLWQLVRDDDMPAKGATAGPLSPQEKEVVRAWIAAGAPVSSTPASSASVAPRHESSTTPAPASAPAARSLTARLFGWLGRFHILVIHFPIALLTAAALAELFAVWRRNQVPAAAVRLGVLLGAGSAVAAVTLGWLHADIGGHGSAANGILGLHRWLGTIAGIWALGLVLVTERDRWRGERSILFRMLLWSGTALVIGAAHFGGLLVHGERFFEW
jgi:mono/diheme cytochrome c family protein